MIRTGLFKFTFNPQPFEEIMSKPTLEEQMYNDVFVPEFVQKCAALGVNLKTQDDLALALDMAARLEVAEQTENSSLLKNASAHLVRAVPGVQADVSKEKADAFMARAAQYVG